VQLLKKILFISPHVLVCNFREFDFTHSVIDNFNIFVCLKIYLAKHFDLAEFKLYWVVHLPNLEKYFVTSVGILYS